MRKIPKKEDPCVIASIGEDVAAYQFKGELLIQTVDVITPVVDDPYNFGAIAAANALSDIYAKGGVPLFALNIVGFPTNSLPLSYLEEILRGGAEKAIEAGINIVGGHTIDDTPKYGLAVTGNIPEGKTFISKAGAKENDVILLTKPIGSGIYTTAIDHGVATEEQIKEVTELMLKLNQKAAHVMQNYQVHACTDVTGFGLAGHLKDIAEQSNVTIQINFDKIPRLENTIDLIYQGTISDGLIKNQQSFKRDINFIHEIENNKQLRLFDPQTSGGLLIFIAETDVDQFLNELNKYDQEAFVIGHVMKKQDMFIQVV